MGDFRNNRFRFNTPLDALTLIRDVAYARSDLEGEDLVAALCMAVEDAAERAFSMGMILGEANATQ
jgi:hypothetical protein